MRRRACSFPRARPVQTRGGMSRLCARCRVTGPELVPARECIGQLPGGQTVRAHTQPVCRAVERVGDVPAVELAALEAPFAVDAAVRVPILQDADLPLATIW